MKYLTTTILFFVVLSTSAQKPTNPINGPIKQKIYNKDSLKVDSSNVMRIDSTAASVMGQFMNFVDQNVQAKKDFFVNLQKVYVEFLKTKLVKVKK